VLRIFAELVRRDPSCWLVLVGRGTNDPAGDIAWRRRTLGLDQRVVLLGERDDVPRLVHAADALLLPSLWEGLPGVVLEACAAGLPVLASDLPGVREIASRLRLVRSLSLDASDAEWAASALELPGEAERIRLRDGAASAFRASVFHIDRAVEAHCAMWRRAAGNGHQ
jgi:glycosyltransferase involved in cell wall biosynthesis